MTNTVGKPSMAYERMADAWRIIRDLLGGTEAMRANGRFYLPQQKNETHTQWEERIRRAVLHNAFADAVDRIVASPSSRPIQVEGLPPLLEPMEQNVDRRGSSLTGFFSDVFFDAVAYGVGHFFVDMPTAESIPREGRTPSGAVSRRGAEEFAFRPFFRKLCPLDVLGWVVETQPNGEDVVVQVRWREWKERLKPGSDYETEDVLIIRVATTEEIKTFEAVSKDDRPEHESHYGPSTARTFKETESRPNTLGFVPIVSLYTNKIDTMEAESPLADLAHLNVDHFIQTAWHRHVLQIASFPILFGSSWDDSDGKLEIGPLTIVHQPDDKARLEYVEHTGAAIQSLERAISKLEEQMETLGMQPFVARNADATATGRELDAQKSETKAQSWVRMAEGAFRRGFDIAHQIIGAEPSDDLEVNIHNDFGVHGTRRTEDLAILQKDRESGVLPLRDYFVECQRRGVLREDADVERIVEEAEAEQDKRMQQDVAMLAAAGARDPAEDEDDEDEDEAVA